MRKLTIVIPDTGPLITLAKANALDLLLSFGDEVGVVLMDMVEFEAMRFRSDHADAREICNFIANNSHRVSIQATSYGTQAIAAAKMRERYDESPAMQAFFAAQGLPPPQKIANDAGELSIVSYIASLIGTPPGPPCLIVAEDDFFLRSNSGGLPGNAHIVSTVAFLRALQTLDPKCDAGEVLAAAAVAGRTANASIVDKPAQKIPEQTTWIDAVDGEKLKGAISARRKRSKGSGPGKP